METLLRKKTPLLSVLFVLLAGAVSAQGQKSFVKSFVIPHANAIWVDVPGHIRVQAWDQQNVQVVMTVRITEHDEHLIKKLASIGRYDLTATTNGMGMVVVRAPHLRQHLMLNGHRLTELVHVEVKVPDRFHVPGKPMLPVEIHQAMPDATTDIEISSVLP